MNKEQYQKDINTIFSCLAKMKESYNSNDNINFINSLEEYKNDIIEFSSLIDNQGDNNDR